MIAVGAGDADLPAVVAAENRQRVFVLPVFLERVDHSTDAVVHVLDERHQPGALVTDARLARLHLFEPILRRLNRRVRRVVSEVHEERGFFAFAIVESVDGPFAEQVGGVAGRIDLLSVLAEIIDTVPTVLVVVVDHVAEETLEMIETAPVRRVRLLKAKVPFADDGRVITSALERPGQKRRFLREPAPVVFGMSADDAGHADEVRVRAAQQRRSRRAADRAVGVKRIEPHAVRHERVDVGRLEILRAVAGKIAVTEVIDENDQDVRLVSGGRA